MAYILIIDDDLDFALSVANALHAQGHESQVETDFEQAIGRMEKHCPDLVILDVMFPENKCGGFELARAMRHHHERFKNVPILMLTGMNTQFPMGFSSRDIDKNWLPVTSYVEKPIDLNVLRQKVEILLEQARV
ncbi:MAG: response regulator [Planctomycetes bacterium]|nr:response regulator [Planctomycetota bacterium]